MKSITKWVCLPLMCVLRCIGVVLYLLFFIATAAIEWLVIAALSPRGSEANPLEERGKETTDDFQD